MDDWADIRTRVAVRRWAGEEHGFSHTGTIARRSEGKRKKEEKAAELHCFTEKAV
jgi:hypothetical protein